MSTNAKGYISRYVFKIRTEVIKELGGKCVACETKHNLEVHHVTGYKGEKTHGRGSLVRALDWKEHISDLELLCDECHKSYHHMFPGNGDAKGVIKRHELIIETRK